MRASPCLRSILGSARRSASVVCGGQDYSLVEPERIEPNDIKDSEVILWVVTLDVVVPRLTVHQIDEPEPRSLCIACRLKDPDDDTGSDGGLRVLTCCCSVAMKFAAPHQAIGNIGCLQQGALGRKVSRQIPRGGD